MIVTTISSATQTYSPPATSHARSGKGRMAEAIAQQQQAGALSSTDATALTSALSSIDSSLQGDAASGVSGSASASAGNRLDPSAMKDRIDSLISDQVSSGALTSDQASELTNLFSSHGASVTGSTDTAAGAPPPPPGPPPSGAGADSGSAITGSSGTTSSSDLLSTFIQQLQAAQSNGAGYGASGTSASTQSQALLFDFKS
jgi:hypothetical protein